jgi:hypothetical protein
MLAAMALQGKPSGLVYCDAKIRAAGALRFELVEEGPFWGCRPISQWNKGFET